MQDDKQDAIKLLHSLGRGEITEDQFHEQTNGSWRYFAQVNGPIKKLLDSGIKAPQAYTPPRFEKFNAEATYPPTTIFVRHHHGTTASALEAIKDPAGQKGVIYAVIP